MCFQWCTFNMYCYYTSDFPKITRLCVCMDACIHACMCVEREVGEGGVQGVDEKANLNSEP